MELRLINKKEKVNITNWCTSVTLDGDYRNCCRTLDFGIIKSQSDKNTHLTNINLGDNIILMENNMTLFHGIVWSKNKSSNANEISINCKDFGIYLNKNNAFYKFRNKMPEQIVKIIASDYNLELGDIALTSKVINRNFLGNSLYDIIMTSYNLANDKKYMVLFKANKLCILEKGIKLCKAMKSGSNLLNLSYNESLEEMRNRIVVYNKNDVLIDTKSNKDDISKYGILSDYFKTNDNKYLDKVNKMLKSVSQKITVDNLGDVSYITGNSVMVKEPYTGVNGLFYIDSDTHNWKNGIYTNKLTLNFENLMDEKEVGSYEKKYEEQQQKEKIVFHKWLE